jgi:hypothetical protein
MARTPYDVRHPKLDQAVAAASIGRTFNRPFFMDPRGPKMEAQQQELLSGPKWQPYMPPPPPPPPPPQDARYWFNRFVRPRQLGAVANRPRPMLTLEDLFRGLFQ